jgi:hypothetical protein
MAFSSKVDFLETCAGRTGPSPCSFQKARFFSVTGKIGRFPTGQTKWPRASVRRIRRGIPSYGRCAEWQGETQLAVGIFSMCSTTITSTGTFCDFKRNPKRSRSTFGSPGSPPSVSSGDHFKSKA